MITSIRKRNNSIEKFDKNKILIALEKALKASNSEYTEDELNSMVDEVVDNLDAEKYNVDGVVDIENVQDIDERILDKYNKFDAARAFILYRENRAKIRSNDETINNFAVRLVQGSLGKVSDDIADRSDPCAELDVIHNQNASTAGGTVGASILQISEAVSKMYWESIYDPEINKMSQIGEDNFFYIHDLGMVAGYCAGWSLKDLIKRGLGGVENKIASAPPKHLTTACTQLVNFLGIMQNEWAGKVA